MLTRDAGCDESQQQELEDGVKSPCTPSFHCTSHADPNGGKTINYGSAKPLDWSPHTPETPLMSVADLRVETVVNTSSTETTFESLTHGNKPSSNEDESSACRTVEEPAGDVAAAGGAALEAVPQKTQERGPSTPVEHKHSYGTYGIVSSSSCHVDAVSDLVGIFQQRKPTSIPTLGTGSSNSGGDASKHAVTVRQVDESPPPPLSGVFFSSTDCDTVAASTLMTLISSYCDVVTLVQLMRVSRSAYLLATGDAVWKPLLASMNLRPLLAAYERDKHYYNFFLEDVITTRSLHGHYTFQAENAVSSSHESVNTTSGTKSAAMKRGHASQDEDSLHDDIFNIASLQLLISAASLGQSNHLIGRVQLLLTYKNESMEVLQGSCRFSVHRRCFSLCCSAFGAVKRGPVFTVAIATVTKPWANESFHHFSEHKNGIRLVMTPVLWEGQSPGSQITENDILVVSRPKPLPSLNTSTTGLVTVNSSLDTPTASRGSCG
ncbi:hypothetical protein, conserved [Leishmania tarentolae]|uniref:F-box domain-containing protein n=1 Tax=Leishmania tarentolae TaxID=5689 RepID=A0A640KUR2_LEITA|nr:hypothetical protein, conserved [Leishmania tarentolae]